MLQAVLEFVNNWFERAAWGGSWEVRDGSLTRNPGLADGQYFRVVGSVFNDGLHRWPDSGMTDEGFDGEVRALAVPSEVVALADRIDEWRDANADATSGPFRSESFGGYSYQHEDGDGRYVGDDAWKAHFRSSLNAWRKL